MKTLLFIHILTLSIFACEKLDTFNTIYDKHIQMAKEKNEPEYKKLLTEHAIDFINTHVAYFKKRGENKSFIDIVHDSVQTDPLRTDSTQYDCIKKDSKAMVIYINKSQTQTNIFATVFKKEKNVWKIDAFLESDSSNLQTDAYVKHMKDQFH